MILFSWADLLAQDQDAMQIRLFFTHCFIILYMVIVFFTGNGKKQMSM